MKITRITFKDGAYSTDGLPDVFKSADTNSNVVIIGKNESEESKIANSIGKSCLLDTKIKDIEEAFIKPPFEPILISSPLPASIYHPMIGRRRSKSVLHNPGEYYRLLNDVVSKKVGSGDLFCEAIKEVKEIEKAFGAMAACGKTAADAGEAIRLSMESFRPICFYDEPEPLPDPIDDRPWERFTNNSTKVGFSEKEIIKRRNKNREARKSRRKNK